MPVIPVPVPNFPGYFVGRDGSVWTAWKTRRRSQGGRGVESYISGKLERMAGVPRKDGYVKITLRKEGKAYDFLLHALICSVFNGSRPNGLECRHLDGIKSNCRAANLCWGTRTENVQDSIRHGTFQRLTEAAAIANRGRMRSLEQCLAISKAQKGRQKSEQEKANLRANHWIHGPNAADIIARREETKRQRGNGGRPR